MAEVVNFLDHLPNADDLDAERGEDFSTDPTPKQRKREKRFGRISLREIRSRKVLPPEYVIDDWMVASEVSFIGGAPQSGKTFFAVDAGMSIATGRDCFGRRVAQGLVIYQIGESGGGFLNQRLPAWLKYHENLITDETPFEILPHRIDLFNADSTDTNDLIECIANIQADYPGVPLRAIFIDTFAKAMRGGDEVSGKDVGRVMQNVERIATVTGAHVCVVHHVPKGGSTLRGHSSLSGDVDSVAMVVCDEETKIRTVKFSKVKDGESGGTIRFELLRYVLGIREEDGKEITSCVCLPVGEKEAIRKEFEKQGARLIAQKREPQIFAALWKARAEKGIMATAEMEALGVPPGTIAVHYKEWRDAYRNSLGDDSVASSSDGAIGKVWERNADGLRRYKILGYARPWIFWTGKPVRDFPETFPPESRKPTSTQMEDLSGYEF